MNEEPSLSVTADEAVARIVNVDYIPEGFTLLEMTAAFLDEAETDCENARIDHLPDEQKSKLAIRANVCETRHQLAQHLLEGLRFECDSEDSDIVRIAKDSSNAPHYDMSSISNWAYYKFGIGTPTGIDFGRSKGQPAVIQNWEAVAIKIYADYKLGVKISGGKYRRFSFQDVGLMGKRKNTPNELGVILIGLSRQLKFPKGSAALPADKTAISKLRHCLTRMTQILTDPFMPFNPGDGWRPRFDLIDDRRNADERAKDDAIHAPLDETRDFDYERDDAQRFLSAEERKLYE